MLEVGAGQFCNEFSASSFFFLYTMVITNIKLWLSLELVKAFFYFKYCVFDIF